MINIQKQFGVKVKYDKLKKIESFKSNFNKLANSSGTIQKYIFEFTLPLQNIYEM